MLKKCHCDTDIPMEDGGTYRDISETALRMAGLLGIEKFASPEELWFAYSVLDCILEQGNIVQELAKRLRSALLPYASESGPNMRATWITVYVESMKASGGDSTDSAMRADLFVEEFRRRFPPEYRFVSQGDSKSPVV